MYNYVGGYALLTFIQVIGTFGPIGVSLLGLTTPASCETVGGQVR